MTAPIYPELAGRVAVVTAGSRGMGAATCRRLAQNGVKVVCNGRDEAAIAAVVAQIQADGGQAIGVGADCTRSADVQRLAARAEAAFGPVDILAAFVGGGGEPKPVQQLDEAEWRAVIDLNLTATFLTVRGLLPGMIQRRRGAILTMASTAGRQAGGASAAYAAAKAGVLMFTRNVAKEVGPHGVRANCLAPSAIHTGRGPNMPAEQLAALFPLGRIGTPEDVASAALFLVSDSASWLTGVTIDVTGGRVMA